MSLLGDWFDDPGDAWDNLKDTLFKDPRDFDLGSSQDRFRLFDPVMGAANENPKDAFAALDPGLSSLYNTAESYGEVPQVQEEQPYALPPLGGGGPQIGISNVSGGTYQPAQTNNSLLPAVYQAQLQNDGLANNVNYGGQGKYNTLAFDMSQQRTNDSANFQDPSGFGYQPTAVNGAIDPSGRYGDPNQNNAQGFPDRSMNGTALQAHNARSPAMQQQNAQQQLQQGNMSGAMMPGGGWNIGGTNQAKPSISPYQNPYTMGGGYMG